MSRASYVGCCTQLSGEFVTAIVDQMRYVTLDTVRRNIGVNQFQWLVGQLGYGRDLPISKDPHVAYFKSRVGDKLYYGVVWSAIEYIFLVKK